MFTFKAVNRMNSRSGHFCESKSAFHQTPQTGSSACVRQLDTSNAQRSHEKEALQLAGCENRWRGGGGAREREGLFHGHPVKGKMGGRGGITAGVRKRQRFRVVVQRVQEVRETDTSSAAGRANHRSLQPPPRRLFVFTDQFRYKRPLRGPNTLEQCNCASLDIFKNTRRPGFTRSAAQKGRTIISSNVKVPAERLPPVKPLQLERARPTSPLV